MFKYLLTIAIGTFAAANSLLELSEQHSARGFDICGTEDGSPVAWIQVNHTGLVTFFNENGDSSSCVLNKGLKAGSWCIASKSEVSTSKMLSYSALSTALASVANKSLSTTPSAATPSTATPSTATSPTTTLSITTLSTATLSTTTLSTATTKNDLNTVLCHVVVYPSSTITTSCSSLW